MKQLFILITAILLVSICSAQDSPVKDEQLKMLISKTISNFPKVKELNEQLQLNDIKDELVNKSYTPSISSDLNYRFSAPVPEAVLTTPAGKQTIAFQPLNNYSATVTINQLIYDFGKTKIQLERNAKDKQLAIDQVENTKNALAYQVTQIYYLMQYLSRAITVQEDQIKSLKENERIVLEKFKNGDGLEYDVLTTQVKTSNTINRLNDFKSQLAKQYILLKWLTGEDMNGKLRFENMPDDFTLNTQTDNWKQSNADAIVLQHRIEAYQLDMKAVKINNRPSVFARATGGFQNGIQPDINQFRGVTNLGAGISIPVLSANHPKQQQKLIQQQIDISKQSLQTIETALQKDIATVVEDYNSLQLKIKNTELLVKQAQKTYELAAIRFKAGLITNAELMQAQTNTEDAGLQLAQLLYQLKTDVIQSHLLVGTVLYK